MSFRKYGGLNFAKSNNIVRNHLSNVDTLEITDHIGASGSQITCNSRLIVTDDVACTNLTAAYDVTSTNLTITEDATLNAVQGFDANPITFNSELLLEKDLVFAPKTSGEEYVKLVFSDGTVQDRLMLTTDTYWQPLPTGNTGSLPDAIFFTKRVVAGVNPTSINDQMEAQNVNFAVSGNAGILGDLRIGASGVGPTFVNNFSVDSNGDVTTNGKLTVGRDATFSSGLYVGGGASFSSELYVKKGVTFDNTLTVVKGATFSSDVYVKGALGVTGGVTLNNTLSVVRGATFSSDVYIKGALGVTGGVTLNNTLSVVRGATFSSDVYIKGALGVTGGVTLNNTLSVVKGATFSSDVYVAGGLGVTGGVTLNNTLSVSKDVTFIGKLAVSRDVTFSSGFYVDGGTTLASDLYVKRSATFDDTLSVVKGATFLSDVYVKGALGVTGSVTMYKPLSMKGVGIYDRLIDTCYVQYTDVSNTGNNTIVYQSNEGLLYDNNSANGYHGFYVNDSVGTQSNPLTISPGGVYIYKNTSLMVDDQPLINTLTTVYYAYFDIVTSNAWYLKGFRKNTPVTYKDDVSYDNTNGKFTINNIGIYKVSLDIKPWWHSGDTDAYTYTISIDGLNQDYMFMLTSNSWYYESGVKGYPSYNTTSALSNTTGKYTSTTAQVKFFNYETDNNSTMSATATLSFYVNVMDVSSSSTNNHFIFSVVEQNSFYHNSYVVIEKISTSGFTPYV